jgi:hypothetical protein
LDSLDGGKGGSKVSIFSFLNNYSGGSQSFLIGEHPSTLLIRKIDPPYPLLEKKSDSTKVSKPFSRKIKIKFENLWHKSNVSGKNMELYKSRCKKLRAI